MKTETIFIETKFHLFFFFHLSVGNIVNVDASTFSVLDEVQNDRVTRISPDGFIGTGTLPPESILLVKESRDNTQNNLIQSSSKRDERTLSVDETILKQEKDLMLARNTIKNLQSHLGTVILSDDSESDGNISIEEGGVVEAEVEQKDSFFASQYTFKTNVRSLKCLEYVSVEYFSE